MLRLLLLLSICFLLVNAQIPNPPSTQSSSTPTVTSTTSLASSSLPVLSSSSSTSTLISTSASTTSTTSTTSTAVTVQQGPVDQPAATTGTPGGPTPYTYSTVIEGVTHVLTAVFTPTSPATTPVTPTVVGTILNFSSWLAIYGPTQTSSAGAGYALPLIPFPLILMVFLSILAGGGMLYA